MDANNNLLINTTSFPGLFASEQCWSRFKQMLEPQEIKIYIPR